MLRLIVRLVVTKPDADRDSILVKVESDQFSPDHLDGLINSCLSEGIKAMESETHMLQSWTPEISVVLTSVYDEVVRPSLHLSINTIQRLADIGASFDFDPYV